MEEEQSFEMDPEMAAAMGFASFGTQPNTKKRKYAHNDAIIAKEQQKTGANNTELGIRNKPSDAVADSEHAQTTTGHPLPASPVTSVEPSKAPLDSSGATFLTSLEGKTVADLSKVDLDRLAKGVRTANGDTAYFKTSFINDPWASLRGADGRSV